MTMQAIMAMEPRFPEWVSEACKDFILKAVKKVWCHCHLLSQ